MGALRLVLLTLVLSASAFAQTLDAPQSKPMVFPSGYEPPRQLPNGGRPARRTDFPAIKDWNSLRIQYAVGGCRGCPQFAVELRGDGTLTYMGLDGVMVRGVYRETLPPKAVRAVVEAFRKAQFFWLFDRYVWQRSVPDLSTTIVIGFDGRQKRVLDQSGELIGRPPALVELQNTLESVVAKYVRGNAATLALLRASRWDFHSRAEDNIRLLQAATGVTEFEGPVMVHHPMLEQLLAAGVPADNFFGCRILEAAARTREKDIVRRMLALGAPLQMEGQYGQTLSCDALGMAVEGGDPEIVKLVLARHPDPNWGEYPALVRVLSAPGYVPGDISIVPVLPGQATRGPSPNVGIDKWMGRLSETRIELLRLLLAAGADPGLKIAPLNNRTPDTMLRGLHNTAIDAQLEGWARDHGKKI